MRTNNNLTANNRDGRIHEDYKVGWHWFCGFQSCSIREGYGTSVSLVNVGFAKIANSQDIYEGFAGSFRLQMSDKRTFACQNWQKQRENTKRSESRKQSRSNILGRLV